MINFNYDKDEQIIYIDRQGKIDIQDLLTLAMNIIKSFPDPGNMLIIDDTRNSCLNFEADGIAILSEEIGKLAKYYKMVKHATIVESPVDTALNVLYEQLILNNENYFFKTFSTMNAARSWIKSGIH